MEIMPVGHLLVLPEVSWFGLYVTQSASDASGGVALSPLFGTFGEVGCCGPACPLGSMWCRGSPTSAASPSLI
jgi:hypothetical protein